MDDVKVSVVMPAFNAGGTVSKSIDSVLNQSFPELELLIVDDASTDNTYSVLERYCALDSRIRIFHNRENLGGAGSRNKAISHARGRFIAFLDSDDLWMPQKLACQIQFMEKLEAEFSFCAYHMINEEGRYLGKVSVPEKVNYFDMLKNNSIGCLTAVYDTEKLGKLYMPDIRKRQDYALWLKLLKLVDHAYGMPEPLAYYTVRPHSLSSSKLDAIRYYWTVVHKLEGIGTVQSCWFFLNYFCNSFMKKKFSRIYSWFRS